MYTIQTLVINFWFDEKSAILENVCLNKNIVDDVNILNLARIDFIQILDFTFYSLS